jgi:tRNA pseudouridine38-40 synthase
VYRYKLTLEYDGSEFVGMQRQNNGISVQSVIEEAISKFSDEAATVYAAGRTDAGVHALAQVVHFDLNKNYSMHTIRAAINHFVKPYMVVVVECSIVDVSFHARFSARSRSYIYKIINREAPLALMKGRAWHVMKKLDVENMNDAAQIMLGKNDLSSFRSSHCQSKTSIKSITEIKVYRTGNDKDDKDDKDNKDCIEIFIKAPSFLHNQVRIIVGCLKKIGEGKWDKEDLIRVLQARDRKQAAATAPAHGLYLYEVIY